MYGLEPGEWALHKPTNQMCIIVDAIDDAEGWWRVWATIKTGEQIKGDITDFQKLKP